MVADIRMEVVNVACCSIAFSMICICALVFGILRHRSSFSTNWWSLLRLNCRKYFSSIVPIKRNLLTHLDGLLVTSLTVGVFGQVFVFVFVLVASLLGKGWAGNKPSICANTGYIRYPKSRIYPDFGLPVREAPAEEKCCSMISIRVPSKNKIWP